MIPRRLVGLGLILGSILFWGLVLAALFFAAEVVGVVFQ